MPTQVSPSSILTVSQLNRSIRHWLENDMGPVSIEGEISNATQATSGHCYFTLKDASAQIRCALFKKRTTTPGSISPKNGQLIIAHGKLSLYEARGDYQLIVDSIEEAGLGDLYRAYLRLKEKLNAEGLFDEHRKKPIPTIPTCIGIITSSKGAALHDITTTLSRRYPLAPTILYPSDVQGADAANQLIHAIERANQEQQCDVIILARGGGSLEDLWPFNNESLAYAIASSVIPIVSGVGHETDFTIADFVADYRAATPTAAAEKVTPNWQHLRDVFQTLEHRIQSSMNRLIQQRIFRLAHATQRLSSPKNLIQTHWQALDYLYRQLIQTIQQQLIKRKHALQSASIALHSLSPLATLARGYAIATHQGHVIKQSTDVQTGEIIHLQLAEGQLECEIIGVI